MKTLIAILIIASFLQSTILPLDLVLIILICRAFISEGNSVLISGGKNLFIKKDSNNLFLAFAFGLFVSHLNGNLLGFQSIIYLLIIFSTHLISKSRFSKNAYLFIPLSLVFLSFNALAFSFFENQSSNLFPKVALETMLCIPAFTLLRFWEERFIVKREIKLRV